MEHGFRRCLRLATWLVVAHICLCLWQGRQRQVNDGGISDSTTYDGMNSMKHETCSMKYENYEA